MNWVSQLTESLANLDVKTVLVAVGALLVALSAFRLSTRHPDRTVDWLIENIQVVLSVVVVVFLIIRPHLFQAFYIPSSSMEDTLKGPPENQLTSGRRETTGDRLLVNKLIYRVSDPKRLDIAVFRAPKEASPDEKEFIKRVIGLPGETVEVVPPRLLVDGKLLIRLTNDGLASGLTLGDDKPPQISPDGRTATLIVGYASQSLRIIADPNAEVRYDPFEVTVDGKVELRDGGNIRQVDGFSAYGGDPDIQGTVYTINGDPRLMVVRGKRLAYDPGHVEINGQRLEEPYIKEPPRYSMEPRELGPNEYFMMGDNRNNSNDSHAWGPLTRDRMIGRAEVLFWPLGRARIFHTWLIIFLVAVFVGYQAILRILPPK